jgi:ADP-heptose:LPS heptosyltransferase
VIKLSTKILATVLLRWQQRRPTVPFHPPEVRSILFVELTRLGDVVTMLPVIQSFRRQCPSAKISVIVDIGYKELFDFLPIVDEVIGCENSQSLGGFHRMLQHLKRRSFDLVCSMSPSSRNALMTLRTPARMKIGYFDIHDSVTPFHHVSSVEGIGVTINHREVYSMENINHRAEKICRSVNIPFQNKVEWQLREPNVGGVKKKLGTKGYCEGKKLIILHPFAAWEYRRWQMEKFLALAEELVKKYSATVVCIGKEEEWSNAGHRVFPSNSQIIPYTIHDVGEVVVLMSMASLFVGNDSGPLHLAASYGTPAVGLFGPAAPELTGRESEQNVYIYHRVECSPCRQIICVRPENPCMSFITIEEVLQASEKVIRSS